jgi:beta-galactosidase/beta-glucuronidase
MMRRTRWVNLNGLWEYAITARDGAPVEYQGHILVPYPIESALSGVGDTVGAERRLWYRRTFDVPADWSARVLLHFEAIDWESVIWVNGIEVGRHRGGYDPFSFDITDALSTAGSQELIVAVWDPTDSGTQPRGKQVREPGGIFYTSVTGIWQTVWLEPVPAGALETLAVVTDIDRQVVSVTARSTDARPGDKVDINIFADGVAVAQGSGVVGEAVEIPIPDQRLWSPDDPYLYDLEVRHVRGTAELDVMQGYFGMRKISVGPDELGVTRLLLNNEFVFQSGPLDQGYWPDGLYTAPTEQAMVYDLHVLKDMGFNMLRKHVKVEPRTFYAACDQLGLLVWQDMPNANIPLTERGSDVPTDPEATEQFEAELARVIEALRNHPSIVMWVPFNEGWGQYDSPRIVDLIRDAGPIAGLGMLWTGTRTQRHDLRARSVTGQPCRGSLAGWDSTCPGTSGRKKAGDTRSTRIKKR